MKLHLGCANRNIPGFYHVDLSPYPHVDHVGNVGRLPFIANDMVSLIYCSHTLPYFSRYEIPHVLVEWYRVLKPGGILRLSVTDFKKMILVYAASGQKIESVIGPILGMWEPTPNEYICFKTLFDQNLLITVLEQAGFCNIRNWDWRTTEHAHIDDFSQAYYPHMDKINGIMISLNVECSKPE